jgi:alkylated DNA repair dioxygenase AlkB
MAAHLALAPAGQLPLFGNGDLVWDADFADLVRHRLGPNSFVDHQPGWLSGSDELFRALVERAPWRQHRRPMFERIVDEPRLTAWYGNDDPWPHPCLQAMAAALAPHYQADLVTLGLNLYRDGRDSVAWHGDRVARHIPEPIIAIVSLGSPRPFLLRPKPGAGGSPRGRGRSRSFSLGWGDLLVMGGRCQQEWDHSVPKQASAAPRISVTFRQLNERLDGLIALRAPIEAADEGKALLD